MRSFLASLVLVASCLSLHATTYYVSSSSGSDTNSGTNDNYPFATLTKINSLCSAGTLQPGDSVLLKTGDVFRDNYLNIGSTYNNPGSATITSHVPVCSGNASAPLTFSSYSSGPEPIIDGADPLACTWTADTADDPSGNTWKCPLPSGFAAPYHLYVDHPTTESLPLLDMPNYVGAYSNTVQYKYLDMVKESNGVYCAFGIMSPNVGTDPSGISNGACVATSATAGQWFSPSNTGIQNVVAGAAAFAAKPGVGYPIAGGPVGAYPGAMWTNGATIYVHLTDNSNPNSHTFEGSHRPYGMLIQSVNDVTVQNITVEHVYAHGIAVLAYTVSNGSYLIGDGVQILNDTVFDWGGIVPAVTINQQAYNDQSTDGILVRCNGTCDHRLLGTHIQGNYVGIYNGWFNQGLSGGPTEGINAQGMDGGTSGVAVEVSGNFVRTVGARGIDWSYGVNGGIQTANELTDNQGNDYFNNSVGGQLLHEFVHESYGEGIQIGGGMASSTSYPETIAFNRVINIGLGGPTQNLYNAIDCNGSATTSGLLIYNNTLVNSSNGGLTQEGGSTGCQGAHIYNNIVDMAHPPFGLLALNGSALSNGDNASNPLVIASTNNRGTYDHNLWVIGDNSVVVAAQNGGYTPNSSFANGTASGIDQYSTILAGTQTGIFVSYANDNLQLSSSSPALGTGENGTNLGALASGAAAASIPASAFAGGAEWDADNLSGSSITSWPDASSTGANMTTTSALALQTSPQGLVSGQKAVVFNGTSNFFTSSTNAPCNQLCTVYVVGNPSTVALNSLYTIVSNTGGTGFKTFFSGYGQSTSNNYTMAVDFGEAVGFGTSIASSAATGTWHVFAITYNGGNNTAYTDCGSSNPTTNTGFLSNGLNVIGSDRGTQQFLNGSINFIGVTPYVYDAAICNALESRL